MYLKLDYYSTPTNLPKEKGARPKKFKPPIRPDRIPPGTPRRPLPGVPKYLPPGIKRRLIRRLLPLPPIIGVPLLFWDVYQTVSEVQWVKEVDPWKVPRGFSIINDCGRRPGAPSYQGSLQPWMGPGQQTWSGLVTSCLAGSGIAGGTVPWGSTIPTNTRTLGLKDTRRTNLGTYQARHDVQWYRGYDGAPGEKTSYREFSVVNHLDPRWQPPDPNKARWYPFYEPVAFPDPAPPVPEEAPPFRWEPNGQAPTRPHTRQPPRRGEKEKKALSRAAKVGIWLWRTMDTISELSEIAGALYKALPEEIRKKANCGGGVNIGQYGSDVNACMMETLWDNLEQLDTAEAFKNIAKNVAEDMTIGQFHRFMSKITPPGISLEKTVITHALSKVQLEAYISQRLGDLFEALGI